MNLRRLLLIIIFLAFSGYGRTQAAYLFGDLLLNMITTWEEGSYEVKYTSFNNEPLFMHGIRGGWYLGAEEKSVLGMSMVFGYASIKEYSHLRRQQIAMVYSTLFYEYYFRLTNKLEASPLVNLGMGAVSIDQYQASSSENYSSFFIFEPNININYRLFPIIKVGVGTGVRLLGGVNIIGGNNISLGGLTGNIFLKFGNFRHEAE